MASLQHKTISGMFWSLLQNTGARGISFVVTIILARILTPSIFGLVGMLAIFIQVSQTLVMAGFNEALIQKKQADEIDYSSVFWLNLALSVVIYCILFFTAPLIADFYHQPVLVLLTQVFSLVFIINAFSYVQEARLRKAMRFRTLTIIHIPSAILAAVISILMAVKGFGVWSIIAMELVSRIAYTLQIWIYAKWRPLLVFNWSKIRTLFSFGGKLMLSSVLNTVYQNIYLVIIGRFFPINNVGYYQTASKVVMTPSTTLSGALNSVAFPVFSSIQDDDRRLKEGFKKIIQQILFWLCPAFVLAGVLAVPLFRFVFTEKWLPAVPYFRILCIVGVLYPLNAYNLSIVSVKGRSDLFLKLEVIKKIFITIGIIAVFRFGILALLAFQAASSILAYFLNSHYSGRFIGYPILEQIKDILPTLLLSLGVGTVVFLMDRYLVGYADIVRLALGFGIGASIYLLIAKYFKFASYLDALHIFETKLANRF